MIVPFKSALAALCIAASPVQAHEFWIDVADYTVSVGTAVVAGFRNGEDFEGSGLSFIPNRSTRFDMFVAGEVVPVPARIGDNPAFQVPDLSEGLITIVHETSDANLTYSERDGRSAWERFTAFVDHKDLNGVLDAHDARGLTRETVGERYRRFVKALVAVGSGEGTDVVTGMRTEFVALANPYTDDVSGGLPVRLLLDGAPRADAQIELFDRAPDGEVTVTMLRTDDEGIGLLPVEPGHVYLADAVAVEPIEPADGVYAWHSLWAALTFAVPEE